MEEYKYRMEMINKKKSEYEKYFTKEQLLNFVLTGNFETEEIKSIDRFTVFNKETYDYVKSFGKSGVSVKDISERTFINKEFENDKNADYFTRVLTYAIFIGEKNSFLCVHESGDYYINVSGANNECFFRAFEYAMVGETTDGIFREQNRNLTNFKNYMRSVIKKNKKTYLENLKDVRSSNVRINYFTGEEMIVNDGFSLNDNPFFPIEVLELECDEDWNNYFDSVYGNLGKDGRECDPATIENFSNFYKISIIIHHDANPKIGVPILSDGLAKLSKIHLIRLPNHYGVYFSFEI